MCAKHYENPTMLSKVTDKYVGDVFLIHTVYKVSNCCLSVYLNIAGYDKVMEKRFGVLESPRKVIDFLYKQKSGNPNVMFCPSVSRLHVGHCRPVQEQC